MTTQEILQQELETAAPPMALPLQERFDKLQTKIKAYQRACTSLKSNISGLEETLGATQEALEELYFESEDLFDKLRLGKVKE